MINKQFSEESNQETQDHIDVIVLRIRFEVLDDHGRFLVIFDTDGTLQLEDIVILANPDVLFNMLW